MTLELTNKNMREFLKTGFAILKIKGGKAVLVATNKSPAEGLAIKNGKCVPIGDNLSQVAGMINTLLEHWVST